MGNQVLGRGIVYFSRFRSGAGNGFVPDGFRDIGNCPAFGLTIENTMLDHYSSQGGLRVKDKSIVIEQNATGSITCDDIDIENVALLFLGTPIEYTQPIASAVDETITGVIQGRFYQIGTSINPTGLRNLTSVVVKVGAAVKVLNTDYTLDAMRGTIGIIAGGGIATGDSIIVTSTRAATKRKQVISSINETKGALRFIANNGEGPNIDYYMPYVKLTPNGEYNLISDQDWQTMQFNIEVLRAPGAELIYVDGAPY